MPRQRLEVVIPVVHNGHDCPENAQTTRRKQKQDNDPAGETVDE